MIKLFYGTDEEKDDLAKNYLACIDNLNQMKTDWGILRVDFVTIDSALDKILPNALDTLLIDDFESLVDIYDAYTALSGKIPEDLTKRAKLLFSYDRFKYNGKVGQGKSSAIAKFFCDNAEKMKIYTCHYCDMAYVNVYTTGRGKKNRHFDLDHVLDKGKCPIVALSLFNLVPVCPICNSRIKGVKQIQGTNEERKILSPSSSSYDFENKVKIWVNHPAGKCSTTDFEKRMDEYELEFDTHKAPIYEKEIELFKLKERYNFHKCEALRLMDLKERYTESRIVELARLIMGDNNDKPQSVKSNHIIARIRQDIFADDFISKQHRVFRKLHKDIMS